MRTSTMTRRNFLGTGAAAALALATGTGSARAAGTRKTLGLAITSYAYRWGGKLKSAAYPPWTSALEVLDHCRELGAGCLQIGVSGWTDEFARKVRAQCEALGVALEGQIGLPKTEGDVSKFESTIKSAKEAGATVFRTVCQSGRRYEIYQTAEDWKRFQEQSWKSLTYAEPVARRNQVKLAVENHKDWRAAEFVELLKRLGSEAVGVTLDFGNNIALLEDPISVTEALAPYALTAHFKDMAVQEYAEGFLLSEVPLGEGVLDLPRMMGICEKANPSVRYNLEMMTRDPLKVPIHTSKYWATLAGVPAADLAQTLALVKRNPPRKPLPRMTGKSPDEQLAFEEENNRRCFLYAREKLGL